MSSEDRLLTVVLENMRVWTTHEVAHNAIGGLVLKEHVPSYTELEAAAQHIIKSIRDAGFKIESVQ